MGKYYGVKHKTGNHLLIDLNSGQVEIYETKKDAKASFTCLEYIIVELEVKKTLNIKREDNERRKARKSILVG